MKARAAAFACFVVASVASVACAGVLGIDEPRHRPELDAGADGAPSGSQDGSVPGADADIDAPAPVDAGYPITLDAGHGVECVLHCAPAIGLAAWTKIDFLSVWDSTVFWAANEAAGTRVASCSVTATGCVDPYAVHGGSMSRIREFRGDATEGRKAVWLGEDDGLYVLDFAVGLPLMLATSQYTMKKGLAVAPTVLGTFYYFGALEGASSAVYGWSKGSVTPVQSTMSPPRWIGTTYGGGVAAVDVFFGLDDGAIHYCSQTNNSLACSAMSLQPSCGPMPCTFAAPPGLTGAVDHLGFVTDAGIELIQTRNPLDGLNFVANTFPTLFALSSKALVWVSQGTEIHRARFPNGATSYAPELIARSEAQILAVAATDQGILVTTANGDLIQVPLTE